MGPSHEKKVFVVTFFVLTVIGAHELHTPKAYCKKAVLAILLAKLWLMTHT